jgi:peroxiredoxin
VASWKEARGPLAVAGAVLLGAAVAAAIVVGYLYSRAPRATRVHVGQMAPNLTLPSIPEGRPTPLILEHGGPTVLIFFDSRWPGSDAYFRYLERMHRRYFRRGLRTVAVALDKEKGPVAEFITRNNLTFAIVSDPGGARLAGPYGTPQDPEAYLLDPEGRVMAVWTERINWGTGGEKPLLEKYLEAPGPGHM